MTASASESDPRAVPRRFSPFRLAFFRTVEEVCARLGGRAFYRWHHLRRGRFAMREETLAIGGLPAALDGFTIVQLSDFHGGSFLGAGDLADRPRAYPTGARMRGRLAQIRQHLRIAATG